MDYVMYLWAAAFCALIFFNGASIWRNFLLVENKTVASYLLLARSLIFICLWVGALTLMYFEYK